MRGSLRIATVAGIGIFIHWTFLILIAWVIAIYAFQGGGVITTLEGLALILAVFACVVLHELGHALTARKFGVPTESITLLPIGGVARMQRIPEKPMEEFLVAIAGPMVNVVIAASLFVVVLATHPFSSFSDLVKAGGLFFEKLMWINIILFAFNLLPAFPMDGGRILRAALATSVDYVKATRIAAYVGQGMAFIFGLVGLFINPFLVFIAIFIYLGAQAEADMVETRTALRGSKVREALMTEFTSLSPDDELSTAINEVLAGAQQEFPIVDGRRVIGILTVPRVLRAVAENGPDQKIADVMETECEQFSPEDELSDVVRWMRDHHCQAVPITESGELVGLLTMTNVMEWMQIRSALHGSKPVAPMPTSSSSSSPDATPKGHVLAHE